MFFLGISETKLLTGIMSLIGEIQQLWFHYPKASLFQVLYKPYIRERGSIQRKASCISIFKFSRIWHNLVKQFIVKEQIYILTNNGTINPRFLQCDTAHLYGEINTAIAEPFMHHINAVNAGKDH